MAEATSSAVDGAAARSALKTPGFCRCRTAVSSSRRREWADSGEWALQMWRVSGWLISLQEMAMLIAVSCLSPVMTQTCTIGHRMT